MTSMHHFRISLPVLLLLAFSISDAAEPANPGIVQGLAPPPTDFGQPAGLPLPSAMSVAEYEATLFDFLNKRSYVDLGWIPDKQVRDTGPWLNGKYYGTHPAVRIFYSPEVVTWLTGGRVGEIPDGAMIIKEQFHPPAARYEGMTEDELWESLMSWTIMVKDHEGSHDGWFWSNPAKDQTPVDSFSYPFEEPISGFGLYCVRCHAAAQSPGRGQEGKTNEFSFISLRNIKGFPGEPLLFRIDDSWRSEAENNRVEEKVVVSKDTERRLKELAAKIPESHPRCTDADQPTRCEPLLNEAFLELFPTIKPMAREDVLHIPPVTYDSVHRLPAKSQTPQKFLTSNQCMSCHAGITEPYGPSMFIPTGESAGYGEPGLHVSPFGEWRWTPMGLAGRDPIFYAQLESEIALIGQEFSEAKAAEVGSQLKQTCLSCHGVMGKRQHDRDHDAGGIELDHIYNTSVNPHGPAFDDAKYGALARDGVSCSVCHQIQPRPQPEGDDRPYLQHFLETSITGNFFTGEKAEIFGPFKDKEIAPYVMEHAIGIKPKHSDFIKSSQMCGTCHTVNLPSVDRPHQPGVADDLVAAEQNPAFKEFHHHVEQATYLEWLNSDYENEFNTTNENAKSCQDCHMSRGVHDEESGIAIDQIQSRIAAVQDHTYPDAENLAPHSDLEVRHRKEGFARHNFRGLNVFMLEMFNQFDDILGVRKVDYMTGSKSDIDFAVRDFVRQARRETADISLNSTALEGNEIEAVVNIVNKAGHRFPSGVGFRRAFIELTVTDPSGALVWSSGRTNELGQIVGPNDQPLKTEFFERDAKTKRQLYQPHRQVITSPTQVQIYETLLCNIKNELTTSFVHGCDIIKDNRFLPKGWRAEGPDPALAGEFLKATHPGPAAKQDPQYRNGSGSDEVIYRIALPESVDASTVTVNARLYYQAIPPYFLKNLFDIAPDSAAVQRLHYLCSNMKLEGTPIENWKLLVAEASTK